MIDDTSLAIARLIQALDAKQKDLAATHDVMMMYRLSLQNAAAELAALRKELETLRELRAFDKKTGVQA